MPDRQCRLPAGGGGLHAAAASRHVAAPQQGELPKAKSFLEVSPNSVLVTAFRRKPSGAMELRAVEVEGRETEARISLHVPCVKATETDLLARARRRDHEGGSLQLKIAPWKIRTFEIR